jgi:hypothetical protein
MAFAQCHAHVAAHPISTDAAQESAIGGRITLFVSARCASYPPAFSGRWILWFPQE